MLNRIALLIAVATIGLAAASNSANAARSSPKKPYFATSHTATNYSRYDRPSPRRLSFGAASSKGPCGVWICTWKTSGGGCLVWEKTVCKVINPFD
jgi:hypothetical protein